MSKEPCSEDASEDDRKLQLDLQIAVIIRSGNYKGECAAIVVCRTPDGKTEPIGLANGILEGGEHGFNMQSPLLINYRGSGLYWYDVSINGKHVTSMPLQVLVNKPTPIPGSESGEKKRTKA
jgi:hypothetical protein